MPLEDNERRAAVDAIQQGKPLPDSVATKIFGELMSAELEKVKMLLDYTKFHLGLYLTLLAAIMAFLGSEWGPSIGSVPSWLLFLSVIVFALAGACGGIIGATAVGQHSYAQLMSNLIGPGDRKWLKGEAWVRWEHRLFWIGVGVMLVAFGSFLYQGRGTNDEEAVKRVMVKVEDALNKGDYSAASQLWAPEGQLQIPAATSVSGANLVQEALRTMGAQLKPPIKFVDLSVQMGRRDLAIVTGTLTSATQSERLTAVLAESKGKWQIVLWVPRPKF